MQYTVQGSSGTFHWRFSKRLDEHGSGWFRNSLLCICAESWLRWPLRSPFQTCNVMKGRIQSSACPPRAKGCNFFEKTEETSYVFPPPAGHCETGWGVSPRTKLEHLRVFLPWLGDLHNTAEDRELLFLPNCLSKLKKRREQDSSREHS